MFFIKQENFVVYFSPHNSLSIMMLQEKKKEKRNACRTALKRSRFDGKKKEKEKDKKEVPLQL